MSITSNENGTLYELKTITANENGTLHNLKSIHSSENGALYEIYNSGYEDSLEWTDIRNLQGTTTWDSEQTSVMCSYSSNNVNTYDYMEGTLTLSGETTIQIHITNASSLGSYIRISNGNGDILATASYANAEQAPNPNTITLESGTYEIYVYASGTKDGSYYQHDINFTLSFS